MPVRAKSKPAARRTPKRRSAADDGVELRMRLRIYRGDDIAFGPGKADLLAAIDRTGSLSQAAKQLDMSYMRAWTLIQTVNHCFTTPLVEMERGGSHGGEARLTPVGREVLELYREISAAGLRAAAGPWRKLRRRLQA